MMFIVLWMESDYMGWSRVSMVSRIIQRVCWDLKAVIFPLTQLHTPLSLYLYLFQPRRSHNMVAAAVPAKRAADTTQDVEMENAPTTPDNNIDALLTGSAKKTRLLFGNTYGQAAMDETNRWGECEIACFHCAIIDRMTLYPSVANASN